MSFQGHPNTFGVQSDTAFGAAGGVMIGAVVLTPAAAVATLTIREGGVGGPVILSLQAAANGGSVFADLGGAQTSGQCSVTVTGTGAAAYIVT